MVKLTNCLSVFDHFVELVLKGLKDVFRNRSTQTAMGVLEKTVKVIDQREASHILD